MHASPEANVSTQVEFKPIGHAGSAAVGPDFAMTGDEVDKVVRLMRARDRTHADQAERQSRLADIGFGSGPAQSDQ